MVSAAQIDGAEHTVLGNLVDRVIDARERIPIKLCESVDSLGVINSQTFPMTVILSDNDLCMPRRIAGFDDSFT